MAALLIGPSQRYSAYPLPHPTCFPQHNSQEAEEWRDDEEDEGEDEILYRGQGSSGNEERTDPESEGHRTRQERRFCSTSQRRVVGPVRRMGSKGGPQQAPCCSYHSPASRSAGCQQQESQNEEQNEAEEYEEKTTTAEQDQLEESSDQRESAEEQYNGITEIEIATLQPPPATEQPQPPSTVSEGNALLRDEYVDKVWEEFVTDFLLGSCHIQKAAIFDLETRRPLASSGDLNVLHEEFEQLVASLSDLRLAYRHGVTLSGKTYKVHLADGRNGILARTDGEGCTVCKTQTLVIIGWHDCRGNSRKCNEDVMRLGDFLRWKGV